MSGMDHALSDRQRAHMHRLDAEVDESERGADHVDDGVERADLVELDALDRHAVHVRLGLGQPREDGEGAIAHRGSQRAAGEQIADRDPRTVSVMLVRLVGVPVGRVGMLAVNAYLELRRGDGGRSVRSVQTSTPSSPSTSIASRTRSIGRPRSSSAPTVMSPLMPEKVSR